MLNRPNPQKVVEKLQREIKERNEAVRLAINPTPQEKAQQMVEKEKELDAIFAKMQAPLPMPTKEETAALWKKSKELGLSQDEAWRAQLEFTKGLQEPSGTKTADRNKYSAHSHSTDEIKTSVNAAKIFERPNPYEVVEKIQREKKESNEAVRLAINPTPQEKAQQMVEKEKELDAIFAKMQAPLPMPTKEETAAVWKKSKELGLSQDDAWRAQLEFTKELQEPVAISTDNNKSFYETNLRGDYKGGPLQQTRVLSSPINSSNMFQTQKNNTTIESYSKNKEGCVLS